MHWLNRVFNKAFVQRFYAAHLMAFLFVALAMFGMADGSTVLRLHYYLLRTAFSSPVTLFYLWLVWLAYSLNTLRYMLATLQKDEFKFIYTANSALPFNLLMALAAAVVQINAPVVIYAACGIVIGLMQGCYLNALLGFLSVAFILALLIMVVYYRLVYVHRAPVVNWAAWLPALPVKTNTLSILLRQITAQNKTALIGVKLFSCGIIYAAHYEWASFNYDIRWMQVALALSIPAQGILIYQVWAFETSFLSFTRNFPLKLYGRYLYIFALLLILLIPEFALLTSYCIRFHILWQLPVYLLYATTLPMLVYAMLFTRGFNQDSLNSFLFAMALATFFVTLFGFTWLLSLVFLPTGFLVYREAFYEFEVDGD